MSTPQALAIRPRPLILRLAPAAWAAALALGALTVAGPVWAAPADGEGASQDRAYTAAMAREHAHDVAAPSEAATTPPEAPVSGSEVTYATVGDKEVRGYLARPQGAEKGLPGILVIHEWWGLNDNIRAMADRLAALGYAALAVDLYGGQVGNDPDGARKLMSASLEDPSALDDNLKQAYGYLTRTLEAPKVGTIGWCYGGAMSLRAALLLPSEIDATVIYYGRLVTDPEELKPLQMPILGLFGAEDRGIPVESVKAFQVALEGLGKSAEIQIYEGANHAFANPTGNRYAPQAAEDAWNRTQTFFERHLKR